jgi:hypothetical protein
LAERKEFPLPVAEKDSALDAVSVVHWGLQGGEDSVMLFVTSELRAPRHVVAVGTFVVESPKL